MIVFSDIDGTLLNDQHIVLQSTKEAIAYLGDHDIPFVIVSARSPSGIYPILKENDLKCHIISYSGGLILDEERNILFSQGMSGRTAKNVVEYIETQQMDCSWNIYSYDLWMVKDKKDERVIREENIVKAQSQEVKYDNVKDDTVVHKILCMCNPCTILEIESSLQVNFPDLSIVKSSDTLVEVMGKGVGKGKAVERLCHILHQDMGETIAFGDNFNDEDMLDMVAMPVIMGNAPDRLKQKYFTTFDNNNDGIYHGLMSLLPSYTLGQDGEPSE